MKNYKALKTKNSKQTSYKIVKIKNILKRNKSKIFNIKQIIICSFIFLLLIIIIQFICIFKTEVNKKYNNRKYDIDFKYEDYERELITDKVKRDSAWLLLEEEARFINGLIRKNKPKNCLEIGVANGGSSIVILNAIKDIQNSAQVSLDLNKELFRDPTKLTGYRVYQYFPELTKNWKLYTGNQPHKFLVNLNMKFDFVFLDSAHATPGEIINFIEVLPF